jgi:oxaloacetate decarboxylase
MHWTDRRERYRQTIAGTACIHPASVHDAISARIAEELGFEIGMFAGSIASFTVLVY